MPEKQCKTCKFWSPRMFAVGECLRAGRAHSKMWVSDDKGYLFTHNTFGCTEHELQPEVSKETI